MCLHEICHLKKKFYTLVALQTLGSILNMDMIGEKTGEEIAEVSGWEAAYSLSVLQRHYIASETMFQKQVYSLPH